MPAPRPSMLRSVLCVAVVGTVVALSGCTGEPPEPTRSATPTNSSTVATPTPTPTPTAVFEPEGSADDNLPVFSDVVDRVWASADRAAGRAYIDALVATGFDKAAMQVTQDLSTVGNPAESIEFSVRIGAECLVGQVGPTVPEPVALVMPALPGDLCLVGVTRPIDW